MTIRQGDRAPDAMPITIATGTIDGTVVADGSNTASTFKTDLTESATDHWKDALVTFLTGSLAGQVKKVSAFTPGTDFITMASAFTGAPSASDRFVMVVL